MTVTFTAVDLDGLSVSTTATFTLVDTGTLFMSQAEDLATECLGLYDTPNRGVV